VELSQVASVLTSATPRRKQQADARLRRGLAACRTEWRLITATHNLLKLWTATPATA
jgi:hypothetical protein